MKIDLKRQEYGKTNQDPTFFNHELIQINNDLDREYMKFIQFWVDLTFFFEKLSLIRRGLPLLRALMTTRDIDLQIKIFFTGML